MTSRDIEDLVDILTIAKAFVEAEKLTKKKRTKRKEWVRAWVGRRSLPGRSLISLTHDELAREDPAEFRNVLRMNEDSFNHLLSLMDTKIRKQDTNMRQAISSRDRLTVTLRFLATGSEYSSLQHSVRIPKCTISQFVPEVCQAIYESLKEEYLKVKLFHHCFHMNAYKIFVDQAQVFFYTSTYMFNYINIWNNFRCPVLKLNGRILQLTLKTGGSTLTA